MTKYICDICGSELEIEESDGEFSLRVLKANRACDSILSHVMEHSQIVFTEDQEADEVHLDVEFIAAYGLPNMSELVKRRREEQDAEETDILDVEGESL